VTLQLAFALPTATRSHLVAAELKALGFVATAPSKPVEGLGSVVDVVELHDGEVDDLLKVMERHAPDSRRIDI
jgi:hypothetical protein